MKWFKTAKVVTFDALIEAEATHAILKVPSSLEEQLHLID